MKVDLRTERNRLSAWVVTNLNRFGVAFTRKPVAQQGPITAIEIHFDLENGRTTLRLTDDPGYEPGGKMRFPKFAELEWLEWAEFYTDVHERPCELIAPNGDLLVLDASAEPVDEADIFRAFGEMIVQVMLSL